MSCKEDSNPGLEDLTLANGKSLQREYETSFSKDAEGCVQGPF